MYQRAWTLPGHTQVVDARALAARVRAMSLAERVAVLEVVDRWWAAAAGSAVPNRERLQRAGARIDGGDPLAGAG